MSESRFSHMVRHPAASWIIFTIGVVSVPFIFVGASKASQPPWDWDTSTFGQIFAVPLLLLSLSCCLGAPFLNPVRTGRRLALAAGALVAFALVLVSTLVVCAFVFGTGIR